MVEETCLWTFRHSHYFKINLFAVYSHNSVQGLSGSFTLPCFTICKPHTQTQKCGPSSLLMQTQGWPTSPTPSNSRRILRARFSVCGSRHLGHSRMYWCVCAVLPPLFHHMYTVCAPGFTSVRCVQSPCCHIGSTLYKNYCVCTRLVRFVDKTQH